jgi:class 3 adenylate cyclase
MVKRLVDLNIRLDDQNLPAIRICLHIYTGEVVAGQIGPHGRIAYGVVGEPVTLASRIEGLTKEIQITILVSESTAALLGPGFRLGRSALYSVKGKKEPGRVAEVLGYDV